MKDCLKCKSYKDCQGHFYIVDTEVGKQYVEWYDYREIRWCPYQVMWIIEKAETLRTKGWPTDPQGSSYTDPEIRVGFGSEAYYVKPVGIVAEVEYRLNRCGKDGIILRLEAEKGIAIADLKMESKDALRYVRGWRQKRMIYDNWLKQRRY